MLLLRKLGRTEACKLFPLRCNRFRLELKVVREGDTMLQSALAFSGPKNLPESTLPSQLSGISSKSLVERAIVLALLGRKVAYDRSDLSGLENRVSVTRSSVNREQLTDTTGSISLLNDISDHCPAEVSVLT